MPSMAVRGNPRPASLIAGILADHLASYRNLEKKTNKGFMRFDPLAF